MQAGLRVPVIRDADRLTVGEIHDRAASLAAAAREGTLGRRPDGHHVHRLQPGDAWGRGIQRDHQSRRGRDPRGVTAIPTPLAIDGGIGIRPGDEAHLVRDHRLVDGEPGARFLIAPARLEDVRAFRDEIANS